MGVRILQRWRQGVRLPAEDGHGAFLKNGGELPMAPSLMGAPFTAISRWDVFEDVELKKKLAVSFTQPF